MLLSFTLQGVKNALDLNAHRICLMDSHGLALTWRSTVWKNIFLTKTDHRLMVSMLTKLYSSNKTYISAMVLLI